MYAPTKSDRMEHRTCVSILNKTNVDAESMQHNQGGVELTLLATTKPDRMRACQPINSSRKLAEHHVVYSIDLHSILASATE